MTTLAIHDVSGGVLAVTLADLIALLGPRTRMSSWIAAPVRAPSAPYDWFDVIGDSAGDLEALAQSGAPIAGEQLLALARSTRQIIWGGFAAYEGQAASPWLTIRFIDSSWCGIETDDAKALAGIRAHYSDVQTL
ncbi:hypothetical protein [Rhizobium sp. SG_E_25_P2]|uniref:hypothetical protein n=1 Tax=Rhizobium sp. SG_E_25_P2 TaxID=2879942 RepID=UPI0024764A6A|nr:hypothetical protein [Rhizobium sp. SG_E_25_P2]